MQGGAIMLYILWMREVEGNECSDCSVCMLFKPLFSTQLLMPNIHDCGIFLGVMEGKPAPSFTVAILACNSVTVCSALPWLQYLTICFPSSIKQLKSLTCYVPFILSAVLWTFRHFTNILLSFE